MIILIDLLTGIRCFYLFVITPSQNVAMFSDQSSNKTKRKRNITNLLYTFHKSSHTGAERL